MGINTTLLYAILYYTALYLLFLLFTVVYFLVVIINVVSQLFFSFPCRNFRSYRCAVLQMCDELVHDNIMLTTADSSPPMQKVIVKEDIRVACAINSINEL